MVKTAAARRTAPVAKTNSERTTTSTSSTGVTKSDRSTVVERAMARAVAEAYSDGVKDPAEIRARQLNARDKALGR